MLDDVDNGTHQHLSTMQALLLESEDIASFLQDFTELLTGRLTSADGHRWCAITLLRDRKAVTAVSSGPAARELDALQNSFTHGPCMTAIRENTVIRAGDLRTDGRWPQYQAAAVAQGVRSVLGMPFDLDDDARAGLNIYSDIPHDFDPEMIATIEFEKNLAADALRLAVRMAGQRESESDLRAAMESRTVIDLAVGIIMGQNRCSQEEAVSILKTASNHRNVKVRELATELVASVSSMPTRTAFES
ncbi:ANTAR domain-containing protein [Brachybacterium sp. AOP35-5H-19]|uniref:ANTAR domain-containing protein n=1 Tax=Brachybacterium sp. AOP35-5H-19 TaxID=3457685 RepID=UPI0040347234